MHARVCAARVLVNEVLDLGIGSPVNGCVLSLKRLPPRLVELDRGIGSPVIGRVQSLKRLLPKTRPPYDSLQTAAIAASFLRLPSPMGLMALKHRGKTATFGFPTSLSSLAGLQDLGE